MALLMQWNPRFDVGIEAINSQHKMLIALMNEFYDLAHQQASQSKIAAVLHALEDLTRKHFEEEEAYMVTMQYPEVATHKDTHASLLKSFVAFKTEFFAGSGAVNPKFFAFLKFWLASHICGIDQKYGAFVKTRKAA